jgi:chemotaxis protein methyltransferase CheR
MDDLARAAGLSLAAYREEHVAERIRRAVARENVGSAVELAGLLRADPQARSRFRRSVAVSASGLFRDPAQFELLERELLPPLLADRRRLAVWSAGCADGSELYSVALILERLGALDRAHLLGSDVLEENLAVARQGAYDGTSIPDRVRARVRWEQRDLTIDGPPPGRWRLVLCRNLAIYLARPAKQALHELLAASLARGGVLLLGRSEHVSNPEAHGLVRVARNAYRRES